MKIGKLLKMISASAALCIGITGCSISEIAGMPPEPQIRTAYSADCTACAYITPPDSEEETEFSFVGKLKRLGTGFWELEITSPETLAGMKISAADDNISSNLGELRFDIPAENIPDSSPFMSIFRNLDSAAVSETALTSGDDGGWVLKEDNCTIIFDGSGIPVSMAVSEPKMTVEFTGFQQNTPTLGESENVNS